MIRRRYTDDQRATALAFLASNGGNVQRTARQLDMPETTLRHWASGERCPHVAEMGEKKKSELADTCEAIARKVVDSLPSKINSANLKDLAVALGVLIDKMLLLRGKATTLRGQEMTDEERLERLQAILDRAKARGNGTPPS